MKQLINGSWIGPLFFVSAILLFGILHPNYSHLSQFISELGASSAPNSLLMNMLGIIPFGLGITAFAIAAFKYSKDLILQKIAFTFLILTGVLFLLAGLYSCDEGCGFENMSQPAIIHNLSAFSAFILTIVTQFFVALNLISKKRNQYHLFSLLAVVLSIVFFMLISKAGIESEYRGGFQRLFLANFIIWLVLSGKHFRSQIN